MPHHPPIPIAVILALAMVGCGKTELQRGLACQYTLGPLEPLRFEGSPLDMGIESVAASGPDVLVAGLRARSLARRDGTWELTGPPLLGVVVRTTGRVDTVRLPAAIEEGRMKMIRVAGLPEDSGWLVVVVVGDGEAADDEQIRVWRARLTRDGVWRDVRTQSLGRPLGSAAWSRASPMIADLAGAPMMAVPVEQSSGPGALLTLRYGGGWDFDVLEQPVVYAALWIDGRDELKAVMVHPDMDASADGNSVFLYSRVNGTWKRGPKLYPGHTRPAFEPVAESGAQTAAAAWLAGTPPSDLSGWIYWKSDTSGGYSTRQWHPPVTSVNPFVWAGGLFAILQRGPSMWNPAIVLLPIGRDTVAPVHGESHGFSTPPYPAPVDPTRALIVGSVWESGRPGAPPSFLALSTATRTCR